MTNKVTIKKYLENTQLEAVSVDAVYRIGNSISTIKDIIVDLDGVRLLVASKNLSTQEVKSSEIVLDFGVETELTPQGQQALVDILNKKPEVPTAKKKTVRK